MDNMEKTRYAIIEISLFCEITSSGIQNNSEREVFL